jgi:DNA-binding NtrC family response regulator
MDRLAKPRLTSTARAAERPSSYDGARPAPATFAAHPPASPAAVKPSAERPKLLFLDDEDRILNALSALFRYKYQVFTATSGEQALGILKQCHVHVVVSDQRMPEMTGVEFLRRAKEISPNTVRILLTGFSDLSAIIDSVNDGEVYRFLNKPWGNQEIQAVVADALAIGLALEAASAGTRAGDGRMKRAPDVEMPDEDSGKPAIVMMHDKREAFDRVRPLVETSQPFVYARNLEECLDALQSKSVAVVVSDLQVGRQDCTELLKLLKQEHPQILTIVLADSADAEHVVELINQAKIFRYVLSPCKPQKLKFFIDSALTQFQRSIATPALLRQQKADAARPETRSNSGSVILRRLRSLRSLFAPRPTN